MATENQTTFDSPRARKARELFKDGGFNCAQAVFLAFADKLPFDETTAARVSSSFGGGMGRLREVCGAVSGMFLTLGTLYGADDPKDAELKAAQYRDIQELAQKFRDENGSIVCRELLGLAEKTSEPTPEKRTSEYYRKRPCAEIVACAAELIGKYIEEREKNNA